MRVHTNSYTDDPIILGTDPRSHYNALSFSANLGNGNVIHVNNNAYSSLAEFSKSTPHHMRSLSRHREHWKKTLYSMLDAKFKSDDELAALLIQTYGRPLIVSSEDYRRCGFVEDEETGVPILSRALVDYRNNLIQSLGKKRDAASKEYEKKLTSPIQNLKLSKHAEEGRNRNEITRKQKISNNKILDEDDVDEYSKPILKSVLKQPMKLENKPSSVERDYRIVNKPGPKNEKIQHSSNETTIKPTTSSTKTNIQKSDSVVSKNILQEDGSKKLYQTESVYKSSFQLPQSANKKASTTPQKPKPKPAKIKFGDREEPYYEFSTYSPHPVIIDNIRYATVEHYIQAMKFWRTAPEVAQSIVSTRTPLEAVRISIANKDVIRQDWKGEFRIAVMRNALDHKFTQHSALAKKLLESGDAELVCGMVNDAFWGEGLDGRGENMLGRLLMELRLDLSECSL